MRASPVPPNGSWIYQVSRNLTDAQAGFLRGSPYWIHDRDPLLTAGFQAILKPSGIGTMKLPARSPKSTSRAAWRSGSVSGHTLAIYSAFTQVCAVLQLSYWSVTLVIKFGL